MTTTLESPDQLAAALDELAESPKLDRHEALAAKQGASVIREQHLALEAACQMEQASADAPGCPDEGRATVRVEATAIPDPHEIVDELHKLAGLRRDVTVRAIRSIQSYENPEEIMERGKRQEAILKEAARIVAEHTAMVDYALGLTADKPAASALLPKLNEALK